MEQTTVVAVVGPTAVGKTALGVSLALALNGEIVSADSMQIYRGMRIASAQPTEKEMQGVPHHLIDFLSTTQTYSVARYVEDAGRIIKEISSRGKLPVLVGGTGLYVNSLLDGIRFSTNAVNPALRDRLKQQAETVGNEEMLRRLAAIDPPYAQNLHPNNLGRVLRALEQYECTGLTMTQQNNLSRAEQTPFSPIMVGLSFSDREILYRRIDRRVDEMLQNGLLEEAGEFFKTHESGTAAQAIGHKELKPFLEGKESLESCTEQLKRQTRRYAKRQLTWFRRDARIRWFYADRYDSQKELTDAAIKEIQTHKA